MDPRSAILFLVTQQVLNGLISTAIKIIPELLHMLALMQPRLVITQVEFFPNTHNGHPIAYICGTYCVGPIMKMKEIDYIYILICIMQGLIAVKTECNHLWYIHNTDVSCKISYIDMRKVWMAKHSVLQICFNEFHDDYTRRFNEFEREYTGFSLSVCPSVSLWR